ncbi:MAG: 3-deoxy-7-phosphoheptulonate synthase [Candidatus Omnitrophica bacterium]|nr:3-deoxy-7-phosphoheptulonate synthase [Candidatus Omnitrophota bacterium]
MSFEYIKKIPTVGEILAEMPLDKALAGIKDSRDREIIDIFQGKSGKFLLIIGPCSADSEDAVCEYTRRLRKLQDKVKDKILMIPRVYTNKPRTKGEGYKGMAHQPDPSADPDISEGIKAIRKMHIRILKETSFTSADEMLYPGNYPYLEDLLSYVAIGARSAENQEHRLTVSGLDIPIGMKNPTSGDPTIMLNSVHAAQLPHTFIYNGWEVKTPGNPLAHCVLRGATNRAGNSIPNYHYEDMMVLADMYLERGLRNPAIIIDTNHANSDKKYYEQPRIAMEVLYSIKKSELLKKLVKGLMIESYLVSGKREVSEDIFGKSITDPCLGWEETEKLVMEIADNI